MRQNYVKTESLGPRKTLLNTKNFCKSSGQSLHSFCPFFMAWNNDNLWKLMNIHETNEISKISWYNTLLLFNFDVLHWLLLLLSVLLKVDCKMLVSFGLLKFWTWQWQNLKNSISQLPISFSNFIFRRKDFKVWSDKTFFCYTFCVFFLPMKIRWRQNSLLVTNKLAYCDEEEN